MPLYGRKFFHLDRNESDVTTSFTVEHTHEKFQQQTLYEQVLKVYALERWTCQCTWRASLTHEQAYRSEIETRKSLPSLVPTYLHKPIFDIVHHNVKPLEKLAEEVSILLGQSFAIDEPVQFKKRKEATIIKGVVERIEENDDPKKRTSERVSLQFKPPSDKKMKNVKYTIRLLDEDRSIADVLPSELQRTNPIPNREKLKTFIRSYAIRLGNRADSPWVFYDDSIKQTYLVDDHVPPELLEKFKKSMTITLEEILREQDRIVRKQAEEQAAALQPPANTQFDDIQIILSDDEHLTNKPKQRSASSSSPKQKKPQSTASKKNQRTLDEMKFTKTPTSHQDLLGKLSVTTVEIVVPNVLLQKLDRARRDRGIDSRYFQRVLLHCARTLTDKQRLRLPDDYRSLIQVKYDELELKRRLSAMTDDEKKVFLQNKRLEQKPIEDLDLSFSKDLPPAKLIESSLAMSSNSIGDLLMIGTFLTSCYSLFSLSLNDDLPKLTQQYLRSFKLDALLNTSTRIFFNYFVEIQQILMKLLFKEDENRSVNEPDDPDGEKEDDNNNNNNKNYEHMDLDKDIEEIYAIKLTDVPLTPFTCQELTRLYLLKANDGNDRSILEKLASCETKDLSVTEQIDLLLLLINAITTNKELMSDFFEYLTRTMSEAARERNQLLAERRKIHDEQNKKKKLQLQNGESEKKSGKKLAVLLTPKSSHETANDENFHAVPINDENGELDMSGDDDLKSVLQRRRQRVALTKELKEKRELEAQKQLLEQKRQLVMQKAEQIYQDALLNVQFGFRIKPLGYDRHYNRYWFFRGHAGLFVEKGWIGSNVTYAVQCSTDEASTVLVTGEKLLPTDESNQWYIYDSEPLVEQVLQSLNDRGIREHNLLVNLKKAMPRLRAEFEQTKKSKSSLESLDEPADDTGHDMIGSFTSELEEIESRLRLGSLGGFTQAKTLHDWQTKLQAARERVDLAELLIQLQQSVADKYASGIFGLHEKKCLQLWTKDCRTCRSYSRLYVLMMIFENSITWNKSTVGMKCKICRKKHKDESIVVCDQCCNGFHQECLRSSPGNTQSSINDLWYCPACRPRSAAKRRTEKVPSVDEYDMDVETASDRSEEHSDSDDDDGALCCVCDAPNDLIQCTQCQQNYHCQCHQPPLRVAPRSLRWLCNNCRVGITVDIPATKHAQPRRASRKHHSEEDGHDEPGSRSQRRSKRLRQSDPAPFGRRKRARKSTSDDSQIMSNDEDQTGTDSLSFV